MKNIVLFIAALMLFVQCSNFSDIRTRRSAPEVKDLARQARGENQSLRRRVLVLPFLNLSPYPSDTAATIGRNRLISYLNGSGEVLTLNAAEIPTDLTKFQIEDTYEIKKLLPIARKAGAHALIVGRIREIKTKKIGDSVGVFRKVKAEVKALVDIEVFSVKSGGALTTEARTATIEEEVTRVAKYSYTDKELQDNPQLIRSVVNAAFSKMVPPILRALRKLNWEGRVALVRGEKVYLNAGRLSGVQVGDLLRVTELREEVYDPETGAYIGNIRGRMKGTVEVTSYFGKDGAITIVHSGSGFKENDLVEFY